MTKIQLTETELKNIIEESVKDVLMEAGFFKNLKNTLKKPFKGLFNRNSKNNVSNNRTYYPRRREPVYHMADNDWALKQQYYHYFPEFDYQNSQNNSNTTQTNTQQQTSTQQAQPKVKQPERKTTEPKPSTPNTTQAKNSNNGSENYAEEGFIPTKDWVVNMFKFYNKKYFDGRISLPNIQIKPLDGNWGYLEFVAPVNPVTRKVTAKPVKYNLLLTNSYYRAEKSVLQTLIHEMVHAYIYTVLKRYPVNQHGKLFYKIASGPNRDGWNITEKTDMVDTDVAVNNKKA
jgi:hypothetical protein